MLSATTQQGDGTMTGSMAIGSDGSKGGGRGNALRPLVWGGAACLLLLPAVAMRFFPEAGVDWGAMDFVVMGVLLAVACGLYELGAWMSREATYRMGFWLAALTGFLTVWVNLAVGMLGSENDLVNLMFVGVLVVASVGSLLAAFRPAGMARAMAAAAIAQLLAVCVGLAMREFRPNEVVLTAMFALPWLASAALFHKAARDRLRSAGQD
jgi:hypothetical protein